MGILEDVFGGIKDVTDDVTKRVENFSQNLSGDPLGTIASITPVGWLFGFTPEKATSQQSEEELNKPFAQKISERIGGIGGGLVGSFASSLGISPTLLMIGVALVAFVLLLVIVK